jgi:hypothetical protein
MNHVPTIVKVGAVDYSIRLINDFDDEYGSCIPHMQEIYICKNQTAQSASDTMLHEIMHAIWNESGLFMMKRPDEETVVRTMSTWVRMVLRDHPQVAAFIYDAQDYWPFIPSVLPDKKDKK